MTKYLTRPRLTDFGLRMLVQWYCPPAVGYTDAISAMVSAQDPPRIKMMIIPYSNVIAPPELMEMAIVAATAAQLLQIFHPVAMMASGPRSLGVPDSRPRRDSGSLFSIDPREWETSRRSQVCQVSIYDDIILALANPQKKEKKKNEPV